MKAASSVVPSSPASDLVRGDRILSINGYPVRTVGRLQGILSTCPVGASLKFEILRGRSRLHLLTNIKEPYESDKD